MKHYRGEWRGMCGTRAGPLAAILLLTILFNVCGSASADAQPRSAPGKAAETARQSAVAAPQREQRRRTLEAVKSWGYQLRLLRFPEIAASSLDLVVIDHAFAASRRFVHQFGSELIDMAKRKPDGSRRLVLAYLSIGEAERYRFYWDQRWYDPTQAPEWLGDVNPVWDGNYLARFWHPDWQRIILEGPDSYLARIQAAGFDGVYLDRADVHDEWSKEKPNSEDLMAAFIQRIATAARQKDPSFLIVMQNAEELADRKPVLDAIDGIAKEDLFYGIDHSAAPNEAGSIEEALNHLRTAKRAGRRILVVEYLDEPEKALAARKRAEAEGFLIHFTRRDLGELTTRSPDAAPLPPVPSK